MTVEGPLQQGACGLGGKPLAPCRVIEAIPHGRATIARVPFDQTAPADEHTVGGSLDRDPRAAAFLFHLLASRDEALCSCTLAPGRRVPVAQHTWAAVKREDCICVALRE